MCLGDDFVIRDESGNVRYQVDGRAFTLLREKLSFIRDRTVDVLDTEDKVWRAYADRELTEDELRERIRTLRAGR